MNYQNSCILLEKCVGKIILFMVTSKNLHSTIKYLIYKWDSLRHSILKDRTHSASLLMVTRCHNKLYKICTRMHMQRWP